MTNVLAIDVGTSAVKVAVVVDGVVVASASESYPLLVPEPGWAEQDPDLWWSATQHAIHDLVLRRQLADIDAVTVTGQMQDLVCLDIAGEPLRPAILYSDTRGASEHDQLVDELGPAWSVAAGAVPDASTVGGKWRWLVNNEPDVAAATAVTLFGGAGMIIARLTGRMVCDPSTAATTALYDVDRGTWWSPIVEAIHIPVPELVAPTQPVAPVGDDVATLLGLPQGVPVVAANGDAAATTIGLCGLGSAPPYAYLGTSGWVAVATSGPRRGAGLIVLPGLDHHQWVAAAPMPTTGAALDWAREQVLGDIDHEQFEALATSTCAASDGVLFVPHLDGSRQVPEACGVLIGLTRATKRTTIAAAVVEGVAHAVRELLDAVAPGAPLLNVCGGAARSNALCQALADVTGATVTRVSDEHATVLGATAAAHRSLNAAGFDPPAAETTFTPDPERHAVHERLASTFDALMPTMAPLLTQMVAFRGAERV